MLYLYPYLPTCTLLDAYIVYRDRIPNASGCDDFFAGEGIGYDEEDLVES